MIYDKEFLRELDKTHNKTIYSRITSLTFDEQPISTIEGRITAGSINVDGASAVRRTCSLTMVANEFDYSDYSWGLNNKFKLEVGVENTINDYYPDIIWFKQGIYIFTSFNTSRSTSNFTISLQGKDKMCLLNGEVGGTLESSVDFGTIEEETSDGSWVIKHIPIKDIILNAVHVYAGEPYHNIIINDLDGLGLELLEYRYEEPMFLYRRKDNPVYDNVLFNQNKTCICDGVKTTLKDLTPIQLEMLVEDTAGSKTPSEVYFEEDPDQGYYVAKVSYGQTAGYRETELTFAGDLIANVGESITSVLDKIKNMLSEFEYFYDIDGQFVFQKKSSYINTLWTPVVDVEDEEDYVESIALSSSVAYVFNEGELITAFNNNPNLLNLRNDYSIWGVRKSISGAEIPVHLRYAIDSKPIYYKSFDGIEYISKEMDEDFKPSGEYYRVDWREVIYQMAKDYYKHNTEDDFELILRKNNLAYYPSGQTGYEKYYIDLQGFWRQLYNPWIVDEYYGNIDKARDAAARAEYLEIVFETLNLPEGSLLPVDDEGNQRIDMRKKTLEYDKNLLTYFDTNENGKIFITKDFPVADKKRCSVELETAQLADSKYGQKQSSIEEDLLNYYGYENFIEDLNWTWPDNDLYGWHKNVYEFPETINFFFDFLDAESELSQFSTKRVGFRSKAVNENTVKSIYFRETPDVIFRSVSLTVENPNKVPHEEILKDYPSDKVIVIKEDLDFYAYRFNGLKWVPTSIENMTGYKYIQVQNIESMFSVSGQGKSAKDRLDELIYNHAYCVESATITTIPIYYLEPNCRIHLSDQDTKLSGDYIVSKLTIPLTYNGTMQITATKAAESII